MQNLNAACVRFLCIYDLYKKLFYLVCVGFSYYACIVIVSSIKKMAAPTPATKKTQEKWCFRNSVGQWLPYSEENNKKISAAKEAKLNFVSIECKVAGYPRNYHINLKNMHQLCTYSACIRPISYCEPTPGAKHRTEPIINDLGDSLNPILRAPPTDLPVVEVNGNSHGTKKAATFELLAIITRWVRYHQNDGWDIHLRVIEINPDDGTAYQRIDMHPPSIAKQHAWPVRHAYIPLATIV